MICTILKFYKITYKSCFLIFTIEAMFYKISFCRKYLLHFVLLVYFCMVLLSCWFFYRICMVLSLAYFYYSLFSLSPLPLLSFISFFFLCLFLCCIRIICSHPIEWRHFCVLRNNSSYVEKLILLSLSYFLAHRNIWGRQKSPFTSGLQVNSPKVKWRWRIPRRAKAGNAPFKICIRT